MIKILRSILLIQVLVVIYFFAVLNFEGPGLHCLDPNVSFSNPLGKKTVCVEADSLKCFTNSEGRTVCPLPCAPPEICRGGPFYTQGILFYVMFDILVIEAVLFFSVVTIIRVNAKRKVAKKA